MPSSLTVKRGIGLGLFLVFIFSGCSGQDPSVFAFRHVGATMGTTFSVKVPKLPEGVDKAKLKEEIDQTLVRVNAIMSTYQPDSELSKLNRNRSTEWIAISAEMAEVVAESLRVSELSGGAYDVTIGPLVNLWGFGPETPRNTMPDPAQIRARLKSCGFQKIHLNAEKNAIKKDDPEIYIDLSSIAKGYGVDQVASVLKRRGIRDYLVEIGGELRAQGSKAGGKPWNIAVEKPVLDKREIEVVIPLKDIAVATSGDYRNFFEIDGVRYSHTIDPRTGMPVSHDLASVTVLDTTTMRADALATAFMVLGTDAGLKLAREQGIAALFMKRDGAGFTRLASPAFPANAEQ